MRFLPVVFLSAMLAGLCIAQPEGKDAKAKSMLEDVKAAISAREDFLKNGRPERPDYRSAPNDQVRQQMFEKYRSRFQDYRDQVWKKSLDVLDKSRKLYNKYPRTKQAERIIPEAVNILGLIGSDPQTAAEFEDFYTKLLKHNSVGKRFIETLLEYRVRRMGSIIQSETVTGEDKSAEVKEQVEKLIEDIDSVAGRFKGVETFPNTALTLAQEMMYYEPSLAEPLVEVCEKYGGEMVKEKLAGLKKKLDMLGSKLEMNLETLDGKEISLSDYRGDVVLVDFWATWCGPCVEKVPHLKDVYEKYSDKGFEILAISLDNSKEDLKNFIKEHEMEWPQHFDGKSWENEYVKKFNIRGIPTMWLVDKKGRLADMNASSRLEEKVKELMQ
ncbi:Thiol-disulfide oxidoreductase ResA [Sedimentisphaera cyanobacteriorum]|uniref:Thiol-disulfide oxidoreductase ResA n=1 Tax=Sedimentisphaera cyanobacteriorum TaxID=1940790 RepID=A0A1Q2HRV2_9BACT|nr:TlpA disulfide reductase family protein [Sedimentisphaera cyanobacteriorum]AQQ10188.1 Thiol-disulfide oxidoreductase ResA [Sedimentisphaera cyanobacteriorum]